MDPASPGCAGIADTKGFVLGRGARAEPGDSHGGGTPSDYTITIAAMDAETPADQRTYDGGLPSGCSGEIDKKVSTINCVNGGDYPGAIAMVEDPQGNTDSLTFTITRCTENVTGP